MRFKQEDIELLLQNSLVQPSHSYEYKDRHIFNRDGDTLVETDLQNIDFVHPQVNSIRKLYIQLSPPDKIKCKLYLLRYIRSKNNPHLTALSVNTLIHLGFFNEAFRKSTSVKLSHYNRTYYVYLFRELSSILTNEWSVFTIDQINFLYSWVNSTLQSKNKYGKELNSYINAYKTIFDEIHLLWKKLNIIKTLNLKEEIFSETSQEITSDEAALKLEFKRNNFPDFLNESLEKISLKLSTSNDNFDYKGCMDLIRSFSESLFEHIAESVDPIEGKKINGRDSEEASKFFIRKNLISVNQANLITAFRHFLSNEGVHRLKSRPDDARLSRNMMIELSLYLLLRLKDIKE